MRRFRFTTKPGEFRAVCRLNSGTPANPKRCELETADRGVFEQHMRDVHGGPVAKLYGGAWSPDPAPANRDREKRAATATHQAALPVKMWKSPKLTPAGKPLVTKADVESCSCGLIAEVNDTEASQLWWREHLERCVDAQAGAA